MAGLGGLLGMGGGFALGGPVGAMIGGALGGAIDGNQETNGGAGASSQTHDPWGPAQPYMLRNLQTNADLQKFYQQHPFNETQQAGYQNQNGLIDKFNGQAAPGLLGFANQMMGSHYQRAQGGAPGSVGYSRPTPQPAQQPQNGLLAGPFSAPQYQPLGKIDFDAMNPFNSNDLVASDIRQSAPTSYQPGQTDDAEWEKVLGDFNSAHQAAYGIPMNRKWTADADAQAAYANLVNKYVKAKSKV